MFHLWFRIILDDTWQSCKQQNENHNVYPGPFIVLQQVCCSSKWVLHLLWCCPRPLAPHGLLPPRLLWSYLSRVAQAHQGAQIQRRSSRIHPPRRSMLPLLPSSLLFDGAAPISRAPFSPTTWHNDIEHGRTESSKGACGAAVQCSSSGAGGDHQAGWVKGLLRFDLLDLQFLAHITKQYYQARRANVCDGMFVMKRYAT